MHRCSRSIALVLALWIGPGCDGSPSSRSTIDEAGNPLLDAGVVADGPAGSGDGPTGSGDGPTGSGDGGGPGPIDPSKDSDGDGLPDGYEALFSAFDPALSDSDGDGVADGAEDDDGDGLTAAQEWAAYQGAAAEAGKPSPMHKDLLIELDYQVGFAPAAAVLQQFVRAYAALDITNLDGKKGINAHIFVDEKDLPVQQMSDALGPRLDYLGAHGPQNLGQLPTSEMVHVMFVGTKAVDVNRGGEVIGSSDAPIDKAGLLIYVGNLRQIFPTCNNPAGAVTADEATSSTFVHEVGHTLQLGHDTDVGGGINAYNIMATNLGDCALLLQRTRGVGNSDAALGATESVGEPRFSKAAADLIKLKNKISVEAKAFAVSGGYEM